MFSADISKSEEISRWRLIDKALHYDFSAPKTFFENRHNCLSEGLTFFPAMGSTRSETKLSPRLRGNTQTHGHIDTQTHRHTDTRTHRHTDTQTHTDTHTDTHTQTHTDTHTHTHTHTDRLL